MRAGTPGCTLFVVLSLLSAAPAAGQDLPQHSQLAAADSAKAVCIGAAEAKREKEAEPAAERAEQLYGELRKALPDDPRPRIGLAQVKSRCRIPFANFMRQGVLVGESNELLEEALALDPRSWEGRFLLAMNHYHTPAFLGRAGDAVEHLETLLAQQGEKSDRPHYALVYVYLGDLYGRAGERGRAVALWRKGAGLFPANALLRDRLRKEGVPPDTARVEGLTVRAPRRRAQETPGSTVLNRMEMVTTPGSAGDVFHAVKTQAGLTQAGDGSDLFVRGGDPAESPVLLDGARLLGAGSFETLHGGLFGVLNPAVIREVYLSSGGFSARYGNALSGVLEATSEGRPASRSVSVGASLAGVALSGRMALAPKVGAWSTLRATDASVLLLMQGLGGEFTRSPRALEGTLGVVAEPRRGVEVKGVLLAEGDGAERTVESHGHRGPFRSRAGNGLALLTARATRASDGAWVRATASLSRKSGRFGFGVLDRERADQGAGARLEGALPLGSGGRVRAGVEGTLLTAREEGRVPTTGVLAPGAPSRESSARSGAEHLGGYVEGELSPSAGLMVTAGLRADRLPGEEGWTADPRLALAYREGAWSFRLGGGVFHQGRWRVRYRVPDAGTPSGVPRRARHLVAGVERAGSTSLRLEGYLKEYGRYAAGGEGPRVVAGRAAGVDAVARWTGGERLNGWITYSFLHGRVVTDGGNTVPSAVDVTHGLTGVGKLALGRRAELGVTARYATGRPYTAVLGATERPEGGFEPVYDAPHGGRLPAYTRLDARLTRLLPLGGKLLVVYLEGLNLLDRRNVMAYTYDAAFRERRPVDSFFSRRTLVLGGEVQLR